MEPIYPLHEDRIGPLCGNVVCIVMKDGTEHVGVLTGCRGGRLYLNGDPKGMAGSPKIRGSRAQSRTSKPNKTAQGKHTASTAFTRAAGYGPGYYPGPYYPFGAALAVDLALIALLFLVI
ncbi:hypothetical protein BG53_10370 [Paenibacillus darwinianus]|uniref:Uncharacterized protein n=1 Tax=Paenibacillus darwinianus TaxID=1380763 RepID=A0A9W5RZC7_9BACL|nr:hypothetical protein [Paenibacillus darwinianus]EXX84811.1 hypothetical protein BG53_10370 [Paenibacillus darwinianus]EXX87055.1 hypothetical protein BG52_05060 [Paenibacillus darwinianus]EXX88918.1 hypothetical protein CH50_02545 [Paenibacillus darwinianus]